MNMILRRAGVSNGKSPGARGRTETQRSAVTVRKFSLLAAAAAILGTLVILNPVPAQQPAADPAAAAAPHKIGLIDMAFIFKNYDKFKAQTEALKKEAEAAEAEAQKTIQQGQELQKSLTSFTQGSKEYTEVESKLIDLQSKLNSFKQKEQREIVRKQAELYKQIYLEVQTVVNQYATYYNYTLVMRFSREEVAASGDPQQIINNMNRQVVFYKTQDDITEPILKHMNQQYARSAGR